MDSSSVKTINSLGQNVSSDSPGIEERFHPETSVGEVFVEKPRITARNVNVFYGTKQAIQDVTIDIGENQVISFIGPSGCGKSTFLRCLNRMNDTIAVSYTHLRAHET